MEALKLQKDDKYANTPAANLKFSKNWWNRFKKDFGFRFTKLVGSRKWVPQAELDKERTRLLQIMKNYPAGLNHKILLALEKVEL